MNSIIKTPEKPTTKPQPNAPTKDKDRYNYDKKLKVVPFVLKD